MIAASLPMKQPASQAHWFATGIPISLAALVVVVAIAGVVQ